MNRVGLHDSDYTRFPNLPLMKLSAWHKKQGDIVSPFMPLFDFDVVYSSKVFTYTPEDPYLPPDTIKGGTGYGKVLCLPDEFEELEYQSFRSTIQRFHKWR